MRKYKSLEINRHAFQKPISLNPVIVLRNVHLKFYIKIEYMLTIISGTNRKNSMTNKVAKHTLNLAKEAGIDANLIDLAELPTDFIRSEQYSPEALPKWLIELQSNFLIPAAHFVIISPEYNGSIPGYLKLFIDALSVHKIKETFYGKQAALIGVAYGVLYRTW